PTLELGLLDISDVIVSTAEVIVWLTVFEEEPLNPLVPRNTAVIGCDPTDRLDVVNVAVLVVVPAVTVPWPISTPLSRKLTVPDVGAGPDVAETVAVNVTDCPAVIDWLLDDSAVVVFTADEVTVRVIGADVLVPNPVAPPYTAVTVYVPAARLLAV